MNPEAGAFYYDTSRYVLAHCPTEKIYFGCVSLDKVNAIDAEDRDASCSLEHFRAHFKKVAFIASQEAQA